MPNANACVRARRDARARPGRIVRGTGGSAAAEQSGGLGAGASSLLQHLPPWDAQTRKWRSRKTNKNHRTIYNLTFVQNHSSRSDQKPRPLIYEYMSFCILTCSKRQNNKCTKSISDNSLIHKFKNTSFVYFQTYTICSIIQHCDTFWYLSVGYTGWK